MNRYYFLLIAAVAIFFSATNIFSQTKYTDAADLNIIGKAFPEDTEHLYFRVDTTKYSNMPKAVKGLFTNTSGIAVSFITDSPNIHVRWEVTKLQTGTNMTGIQLQGLDFYIKCDGRWVFAGAVSAKDKVSERIIAGNMDNSEKECLLYLPCYGGIESLEIGVDKDAAIYSGKNPFKGKIVVYGSSITQGASASRPGMAYPAILSRKSGYNFVNLGLSGSGKMEPEVAAMLSEIKDADAFILDCIANPNPDAINERTQNFVSVIRNKYPSVPIVFIQSVVRESGNFNLKVRENNRRQNEAIAAQFEIMKKKGVRNIYLIRENDFLGKDHEGTVDGTHPNDLGFDRFVSRIRRPLSRILKIRISGKL